MRIQLGLPWFQLVRRDQASSTVDQARSKNQRNTEKPFSTASWRLLLVTERKFCRLGVVLIGNITLVGPLVLLVFTLDHKLIILLVEILNFHFISMWLIRGGSFGRRIMFFGDKNERCKRDEYVIRGN